MPDILASLTRSDVIAAAPYLVAALVVVPLLWAAIPHAIRRNRRERY